jgi:hypothetical protein
LDVEAVAVNCDEEPIAGAVPLIASPVTDGAGVDGGGVDDGAVPPLHDDKPAAKMVEAISAMMKRRMATLRSI